MTTGGQLWDVEGASFHDAASDGSPAPEWAVSYGNEITARLNQQDSFHASADNAFGPAVEYASDARIEISPGEGRQGYAATARRDIWREGPGHIDRVSLRTHGQLRRGDGAPLPPTGSDRVDFTADGYDLRYTRGWPVAQGRTSSGLEYSLTPHAGVGVSDQGGSAEAGATLRIGSGLERMVPEGSDAFGQRARWYVYVAGSGRAVGYNFARNRDGDFARSGYSHDSGAFLGDASAGVAYRRGPAQASFGLVYRQIKARGPHGGLRGGEGIDDKMDEGLVAFQLSIKPQW